MLRWFFAQFTFWSNITENVVYLLMQLTKNTNVRQSVSIILRKDIDWPIGTEMHPLTIPGVELFTKFSKSGEGKYQILRSDTAESIILLWAKILGFSTLGHF